MFFVYVLIGQLIIAAIVVFVLKKKLDQILIDLAVRQAEVTESQRKAGAQVVTVVTHKSLIAKDQDPISRRLVKSFRTPVTVSFLSDPSIMGGVIIKFGNEVIDCSLRERLRQARQAG
jgi:F0F1-type ATP synthase delta subunit